MNANRLAFLAVFNLLSERYAGFGGGKRAKVLWGCGVFKFGDLDVREQNNF